MWPLANNVFLDSCASLLLGLFAYVCSVVKPCVETKRCIQMWLWANKRASFWMFVRSSCWDYYICIRVLCSKTVCGKTAVYLPPCIYLWLLANVRFILCTCIRFVVCVCIYVHSAGNLPMPCLDYVQTDRRVSGWCQRLK